MKYSIHILTTHKNKNRQKTILDTWLKEKNNYIFYTDKTTGVGNQAEVDPDDTYYSNGKKNLAELLRVYRTEHYKNVDWMLFCDDDTCVNLSNLEELLPTLDPLKMYGSLLSGTWPGDTGLKYLSGGAGYLIPSKLIEKKAVPDLGYLLKSYYSDVCVGLWARDNDIEMVDVKGFYSQDPSFYNLTDEDIKQSYTFHYIKECSSVKNLLSKFNNDDKTKNTLCLVTHQGMGDHIECNGMVRHFANIYDEVVIFGKENYYDFVSFMYRDANNITIRKISKDPIKEVEDIQDFINQYKGDVIVAGFSNYNSKLQLFKEKQFGPAQAFYFLANVPFKYRKEKFYFKRDLVAEEEAFKKLNPDNEKFIFVHDDPIRGFHLEIDSPLKIIRNDPTIDFFSMLGVITRASEIHCMSSSYFCLIDCMGDENFIGKKYYHSDVRGVELFETGIQGSWHRV